MENITDDISSRVNRVSAELVHDHIHGFHIGRVDLVFRVALGKTLDELVQSRLVIANGGGKGVDGLFASGWVGVGCRDGHEGGNGIQDDELCSRYVSYIFFPRSSLGEELAYLILSLLIVLHGSTDTPSSHTAHISLLMLKQLDQRSP